MNQEAIASITETPKFWSDHNFRITLERKRKLSFGKLKRKIIIFADDETSAFDSKESEKLTPRAFSFVFGFN